MDKAHPEKISCYFRMLFLFSRKCLCWHKICILCLQNRSKTKEAKMVRTILVSQMPAGLWNAPESAVVARGKGGEGKDEKSPPDLLKDSFLPKPQRDPWNNDWCLTGPRRPLVSPLEPQNPRTNEKEK